MTSSCSVRSGSNVVSMITAELSTELRCGGFEQSEVTHARKSTVKLNSVLKYIIWFTRGYGPWAYLIDASNSWNPSVHITDSLMFRRFVQILRNAPDTSTCSRMSNIFFIIQAISSELDRSEIPRPCKFTFETWTTSESNLWSIYVHCTRPRYSNITSNEKCRNAFQITRFQHFNNFRRTLIHKVMIVFKWVHVVNEAAKCVRSAHWLLLMWPIYKTVN